MSFATGLSCRACGERYPISPIHTCDLCFAPLEVAYDDAALRRRVTRELIESGPPSLWRYRSLLPLDRAPVVGLHSGWTPLRRAQGLEQLWGCREIWLKDDTTNSPTLTCKERVVCTALNKALEAGFTTVACASRGNLGNSLAAHAVTADLPCYVLVQSDLDLNNLAGALVCGARVVRVRGSYADVNRLCCEVASDYGWAIVNLTLRPFYTEGAKTFGFEIAEQLGWRLPEHVVLPVGGGTLLPAVWRGFQQLVSLGLIEETPCRVHAAQAAGCSPVVRAVHERSMVVRAVEPKTIALNIAVGNPSNGRDVVRTIQDSGGWAEAASDAEIIEAVKLLARTEGVWSQAAGGAAVAVTKRLLDQKRILPEESVVIGITGHGCQTSGVLSKRLEEPATIDATLGDFRRFIKTEDELRDAWERLSTT